MATRLQRLRRGGLNESFPFAGPSFRRAAPWLLVGLAALGLLARVFPALRWAVWGSDSGEYQLLTRQLVDTGRVLFPYHGWGVAYPYFPGMFVVSGAVHAVLGVDGFYATQWTVPVLAASLPVLVALLAYRVTGDPRVGVLAGAFVAVSGLIVVTSSHAMPGTLGQVLLLTLLAFLPDGHRDKLHWVVFVVLAVAIVWSHHLTSYFAVGTLAFIPFYREMTQRTTDESRLRVEAPLAALLLALNVVWWFGVATPFRDQIVGTAFPLPAWLTAFLFLVALAALPALVWLKRARSTFFQRPRYPHFPRQRLVIAGLGVGLIAVVAVLSLVRIPGGNIRPSPLALVYTLPVIAFLAFVPLGASVIRFHRHNAIVLGFMWAILASLAFAIVTNSRVLFPFRHVDYMGMAMAPLAALGMLLVYDQTLASRIPADRARTRASFIAAVSILLAISLVLAFPPREVLGGFQEGVTDSELEAVQWVEGHHDIIPVNATMAADHRVSSLMWGLAHVDPTWDYTPRTYHGENASDALAELRDAKVPALGAARIDYVFLSQEIEDGVTLDQFSNSAPMTEKAIAKFDESRVFEPVYQKDDVRIYRVNWTAAGPNV